MQVAGQLVNYQIKEAAGQIHISIPDENLKNGRPLISARNPEREADRILAGFQLKAGQLAVVLGAAHLALLRKLKEMVKAAGGQLVVLEADPVLASVLMKEFPEFKGVPVITPANWPRLELFIESQQIEQLTGYRIMQVPGSVQLDRAFYKEAELEVKRMLASRIWIFLRA